MAPKGGSRSGPAPVLRPEGAAPIALVGSPNAGKSPLHARRTGSHAQGAPYPFTAQFPEPGTMPRGDIHLQLVDLPAVSPEHPAPRRRLALVLGQVPADAQGGSSADERGL